MNRLIVRFIEELHTRQARAGRRTGSRMYATPALLAAFLGTALGATPEDPLPRQRQPTALCLSADGARLFVANGRSGSLSVVDLTSAKVVAERDVGRGLADLAALPGEPRLLAVDQAGDALLLLEERDNSVRTLERLAVASDPISLAVAPGGGSCVVASRGSRRLTFIRVSPATGSGQLLLEVSRTLDLPFSPRNMVLVRSGARLVVADAFAGRLAVIDPTQGTLESVRALPAHNIRALAEAPDGKSLIVAHQVLHRLARTSFEDVHWGSLLNNALRVLKLDQLLAPDPGADLLKGSRQIDLGDPGNGSGDPAAAAFARDGHLVIALAGVDGIRIGTDPARLPVRTGVGRRPTALAVSADSRAVYVANTLDDTITVVDLSTGLFRASIALGSGREPSAAERGESLFFDARLSHDGWMSCHSCHTDGHSSGQSSDTLGDGGFGAPKRVPSLLGVGATGPWGWLGGFERLEDQVRQSIASTMQGPTPNASVVSDLVAYLRTLEAPAPAAPTGTAAAVERGRAVFRAQKCAECHAAPEFTSADSYDVGLIDEVGHRRFNAPSLRGVGRREPLLHDGRAATLDDVFRRYRHPRETELSDAEAADLVAFLKTL